MALSDTDHERLMRAIGVAHGSLGLSDPNPRVGCIIHAADGSLAGEGFTQQAGGAHAEVMAMRNAGQAGRSVAGGTAWVSLEPCAHHGRTPPCADALIDAGIARVVVATTDPFPQVAGKGIERLRAAGVVVDLAEPGPTRRAAHELNIGFFSRVQRQRPWVRLKVAASVDGRTALPDGSSQWITGEAARKDGHAWRRRAGAVLTGIGTLLADDPQLDVRLVPTTRQPLRVVVDSGFNTPVDARLLQSGGRVLVAGARDLQARMERLRHAGAEVLRLPDANGQVDLQALLERLTMDGVNELHIEGGARLNGALLQTGWVDEVLLYLAPKLLGPGRDIATLPTLTALPDAQGWRFEQVRQLGPDLCVLMRRQGADAFLS